MTEETRDSPGVTVSIVNGVSLQSIDQHAVITPISIEREHIGSTFPVIRCKSDDWFQQAFDICELMQKCTAD